jgi:hypothetical protein
MVILNVRIGFAFIFYFLFLFLFLFLNSISGFTPRYCIKWSYMSGRFLAWVKVNINFMLPSLCMS